MKLFALSLTLLALTANAFASGRDDGEAEFARKIAVLGKMAYGVDKKPTKVRGEDAQEMVLKMYMKHTGEDRAEAMKSFTVNAKAKDIGFSEETGWGTFSASEAAKFFGNLHDDTDSQGNDKDTSKRIAVGSAIIKELGKMGAKFGFTDSTSGYCGISFRGLLVIDETNEEVHEVAMGPSGGC